MKVHLIKHVCMKDGTEFDVEYDEDIPTEEERTKEQWETVRLNLYVWIPSLVLVCVQYLTK